MDTVTLSCEMVGGPLCGTAFAMKRDVGGAIQFPVRQQFTFRNVTGEPMHYVLDDMKLQPRVKRLGYRRLFYSFRPGLIAEPNLTEVELPE